jgi:hypothetical protein
LQVELAWLLNRDNRAQIVVHDVVVLARHGESTSLSETIAQRAALAARELEAQE